MESDHPERAFKPCSGGSPEAGDRSEYAHGLGMERGESAGHPGPTGHSRDANSLICFRVAVEEPADQDSEVLSVPLEVPFGPRSEGPGALGEGHHGSRRAESLHRTQSGLALR